VIHAERLLHGRVESEHVVHFFDDDRARVNAVFEYVAKALLARRSVVVLARRSIWRRIAAGLKHDRIVPVGGARLLVLDATATVAGLMRCGYFAPELFRKTLVPIVKDVCLVAPVGVSAYGEMVDVLAAEGNFEAAQALEHAWNELAGEASFKLLCGYSSAHFAEMGRHALAGICAAHSTVRTDSSDALGRWLVLGGRPS
jgi:hypothetical protein